MCCLVVVALTGIIRLVTSLLYLCLIRLTEANQIRVKRSEKKKREENRQQIINTLSRYVVKNVIMCFAAICRHKGSELHVGRIIRYHL